MKAGRKPLGEVRWDEDAPNGGEYARFVYGPSNGVCINADGSGWIERNGIREELKPVEGEAFARAVFGDWAWEALQTKGRGAD